MLGCHSDWSFLGTADVSETPASASAARNSSSDTSLRYRLARSSPANALIFVRSRDATSTIRDTVLLPSAGPNTTASACRVAGRLRREANVSACLKGNDQAPNFIIAASISRSVHSLAGLFI